MGKIKHIIYSLALILLFASCASMKQTSIDVLKPAKMIVPDHIRKIVLVDNTIKQPSHVGNNTYVIYWKNGQLLKALDGTDTIEVDSLGVSVVFNTANTLLSTAYYDTVVVWPTNMADPDKEWTKQRLKSSDIIKIARETNSDAVYSLDAYTYENSLIMQIDQFYGSVSDIYVELKGRALWRFYDVRNNKALKHQIVIDSLFREGELYLHDYGLPTHEEMLLEMAWQSGEASGRVMSPSWKKVNRVYFIRGSSEFKLAEKHLEKGNVENFMELMLPLYEHGKRKVKARSAFNMAFYYELSDQIPLAIDWINKSTTVYEDINSSGLYDEELRIANTYLKVLELRLKENEVLDKQF